MNKIKAIIVDDEELARQSLKISLSNFNQINVIKECANGFEAIKAVGEYKPDVVFLDIQMPKLTGFDVVELLGDECPLIIFVTAYDEYAVKAFEAQAIDYILKPASRKRLSQTIEKVEKLVKQKQIPMYSAILNSNIIPAKQLCRVLIRDKSKVHVIQVNDIIFFEAQGDYVSIQTATKSYLKQERLSNFEQRLDGSQFQRTHRSYIVNIAFIDRIAQNTKDSKIALLKNGKQVPISRSGYERLMKIL